MKIGKIEFRTNSIKKATENFLEFYYLYKKDYTIEEQNEIINELFMKIQTDKRIKQETVNRYLYKLKKIYKENMKELKK